ncbi:DUF4129 domain-containing protein [Metabacillus litoralis]|uniref:DUF4129 domain-containing protein n=1 Tax=Metabacillus litoralis TaxID=152268 RepID=UPI001CFE3ECB|nr:DUF4129 domain-containing protein [Metabacillus litoralis]
MLNEEKAKQELQEILTKREYKVYEEKSPGFIEKWWDSVEAWFAEWLEDLFPSIEPSSGFAGEALMILIVVVILVLLVFVILSITRSGKRKRALKQYQPLQSIGELQWSYQKHLGEAQTRELQGEYNLSTRHLFLALLLYFHEKEWLKARIWKTNWEYYDELMKVNKEWAHQFYDLAQLFDEVTYGERTVEEKEYLGFKNIVMNLLEYEESYDRIIEKGERKGV